MYYALGFPLKPCPFCGRRGVWFEDVRDIRYDRQPQQVYGIFCENQSCIMHQQEKYYTTEIQAGDAWNRRYGEKEKTAMELCKEQVKSLEQREREEESYLDREGENQKAVPFPKGFENIVQQCRERLNSNEVRKDEWTYQYIEQLAKLSV